MEALEQQIMGAFPLSEWSRRRVCLAVSGGPDSVALVRAMAAIAGKNDLQKNLRIVTVNHQLRGKESDADVLFVLNLGKRLGLDVEIKTIDYSEMESETQRLGSLENAARNLRYRLLSQSAKDYGARFIVTAHHLGDQLETILFRLFRGSGLDGLEGIASTRAINDSVTLVRPMLSISKTEILDYLARLNQDYRVDSSNMSPDIMRNRVRHELIPLLDQLFPNRWSNALLRLAQQSVEVNDYLDDLVDEFERVLEKESSREKKYQKALIQLNVSVPFCTKLNEVVEFPIRPMQNVDEEILKRFLRRVWKRMNWPLGNMGHNEWTRLANAVQEKKTTRQFPGNVALFYPNEFTMRLERITDTKS